MEEGLASDVGRCVAARRGSGVMASIGIDAILLLGWAG